MDETNSMPDVDLYFSIGNLGIGKQPTSKLDVNGDISTDQLNLPNSTFNNFQDKLKISHNDSSNIILSQDKSIIFTKKLGINNNEPNHTLDVEGDIRFTNNLHGKKGMILSEDSSISINKNNNYENVKFFSDLNLVNESNLSIQNKIIDSKNNELLDFSTENTFAFNKNYKNKSKDISFYGPVNFIDENYGVNIGGSKSTNVEKGSLYVDNKIKTNKLEFPDTSNRHIYFEGDNASNIKLGKYSYLSNLSTNPNSNQTSLLGHNLYADNDNVRIAETTDDYGYRGMAMNNINGIQFYTSNKETKFGDIPELPQVTISNSGQLIYTIPVLPYDFDIDNLDNDVYKYIKNELSNKRIGSTMTFTTQTYLNKDMIFNAIKNSGSTIKCYIIDKKTNNVNKYFDVSF